MPIDGSPGMVGEGPEDDSPLMVPHPIRSHVGCERGGTPGAQRLPSGAVHPHMKGADGVRKERAATDRPLHPHLSPTLRFLRGLRRPPGRYAR